MAVWMDLTNSMYSWGGGVVGIIRAELEIAKNLHKCDLSIRFSAYDGVRFVEIAPEKLSWLWETDNVVDAYMKTMGRTQSGASKEESLTERYSELALAYGYSASRFFRLSHGVKLYLETLPAWLNDPLRTVGKIIVSPMRKILLAKTRLAGLLRSKKISSRDDRSAFSFSYPYENGDVLFSCGWCASEKEMAFARVKYELRHFTLTYLVYDLIPILPETKSFYDIGFYRCFTDYFAWISFQCDYIFYGGKTAMEDAQKYQRDHEYPVPTGFPVKFGSNIVGSETYCDIDEVRKKYSISEDYLLMVGSLDMRKNYGTIYRAYTILIERYGQENVPDLAIIGKGELLTDLSYTIKNDPQVKDKIIMLSPDDRELDCLYKNCLFFLLASAYEGWSLTLPEALGYHKFCIVSDVPPLREIGEDLVEYVDTYDPFAWAEQIWRYTNDRTLVREREDRIKAQYHAVSWADCGNQIYDYLREVQRREQTKKDKPVLFLDASTMWNIACSGKNVSGIVRTEILLIYYLFRKYKNIKCFTWNEAIGFRPIYASQLMHMLCAENPTEGFLRSRSDITHIDYSNIVDISNKATAFWFICSALPSGIQKRLIAYGKKRKAEFAGKNRQSDVRDIKEERLPFRKGDVIFVPGAGSGPKMHERILKAKEKIGCKYSHIIYDYTPILFRKLQ